MSTLARDPKSGSWRARKAIPPALQPEYERSFGKRWEEILGASNAIELGPKTTPFEKAQRWVPLLLAYTGSRPGEICQLRKQDLIRRANRWALRLTSEAGTIKDGDARITVFNPSIPGPPFKFKHGVGHRIQPNPPPPTQR